MAPSTKSVSDKDVVASIKKGISIPKAAAAAGIAPSVMAGLFYKLEPVADPSLKITGSPAAVAKQIVDGRNAGLRWERLAARSGKTVAEVKAIFEGKAGVKASESYSGRGRRFNGSAPASKAPAKKAAGTKAPAKKAPAAKAGKARARTRAERQAKGSPS